MAYLLVMELNAEDADSLQDFQNESKLGATSNA